MSERLSILVGDVLERLAELESESVHCVCTSPPYWALRDYGTGEWEGGSEGCDHLTDRFAYAVSEKQASNAASGSKGARDSCPRCGARRIDKQLGLEPVLDCLGWATGARCGACYICRMVQVFGGVKRVLRRDGTVWLNIGDSYNANTGNGFQPTRGRNIAAPYGYKPVKQYGIKPKDLCMVPARLALALQADGWYIRQDLIWHKSSPMPESVTDRCTKAHEYIWLLSRSARYYYDADAVREAHAEPWRGNGHAENARERPEENLMTGRPASFGWETRLYNPAGRNKRSVWTVPSESFPGAHFACVDEETECLTLTGWKHYTQLRRGELLAAYDVASGTLQYEPLQGVAVYPYDGKLVQLGGRDLGMLCTPNHRCIVKTRTGNTSIRRADALVGGLSVPCAADWVDGSFGSPDDPGLVLAELIGWAVAEGHSNEHSFVINQSQTANPAKVDRIRCLLDKSGFHYKEYHRIRNRPVTFASGATHHKEYDFVHFSISGAGHHFLKGIIGKEKRLPWYVTQWSRESIAALLDGIRLGDGHTREDGRFCVIQKGKPLIDMVQILAMRLGWRCIVSPRQDGNLWTAFVVKRQWHSLRGSGGHGAILAEVSYQGNVWCPSLPSGTFVARRRGRVWITGNTYPRALIRPCILAGTSERGCCPKCGKCWERVVEDTPAYAAVKQAQDWKKDRGATMQTGNEFSSSMQIAVSKSQVTTGWRPGCTCDAGDPQPCTVLDPFIGSGTTALVALEYNRRCIGIELNPEYAEMARRRCAAIEAQGVLAELGAE